MRPSIDKDREALQCIRKNIEALGLANQSVVLGMDILQGLRLLAKQGKQFGIIFSDPPYREEGSLNEQILAFVDEHALLAPEGLLFLENPVGTPTAHKELKTVSLKNSRRLGCSLLEQFIAS